MKEKDKLSMILKKNTRKEVMTPQSALQNIHRGFVWYEGKRCHRDKDIQYQVNYFKRSKKNTTKSLK